MIRGLFNRYFAWRLPELVDGTVIALDYPVEPKPRYGYGAPAHAQLAALIGQNRENYAAALKSFAAHTSELEGIPFDQASAGLRAPNWNNGYFSKLDAMALYCFLRQFQPRTYLEVGSGNSTRFARRAIENGRIGTRIVSIDPNPRAEIDQLCDEVVRVGLEASNPTLDVASRLNAGDILFIDNSHRALTNSDVTVSFLEVLPLLVPGVVVHLHDIFRPFDYPTEWSGRFYTEQYLLACWLLGGKNGKSSQLDILLPNAFIGEDRELRERAVQLFATPNLAQAMHIDYGYSTRFLGCSFWFRVP